MKAMTHTLVGSSLALFGFLANAEEAATKPIALDIKPQPMVDALNGWAQQTGFQIIWPDEESTSNLAAPRIKGKLTAQAALNKLLAGTSLTYEFVNGRTVAIREEFPAPSMVGKQFDQHFLRVAAQVEEAGRSSPVGVLEPESRVTPTGNQGRVESREQQLRGAMDEVVVTAQKREERLQDVPLALSVLGGEELDKFTGRGVMQALDTIPGVNATTSELADGSYLSAGGSMVTIRGAGPSTPVFGGSSPVAVYVDSSPFGLVNGAIAPDPNAYDLQRVEILKGPQGTLYGANALNGVMRILTHDVDLHELDFKTRLSVASIKDGAEQYRGDAALNLPVVPGKWAARAVVGYTEGGGWIDGPAQEDINDVSLRNFRLKVKGQPSERLSLGASAWISRSDYGAPNVGDTDDFNPGTDDAHARVDYDAFGLNAGYEFAGFNLTSDTTYIDYLSYTDADYTGIAPILTPEWPTDLDARVWAQEINLASTGDGPWRWTTGLFYRDAEDRIRQAFYLDGADLVPPLDFEYRSRSYALYGELTRSFMDGLWELTGGLRYFEDDADIFENIPSDGNPATPLIESSTTFDNVSPRLILAWHPRGEAMFYASYSEGFRSGSNQTPGTIFAVVNGLGIDVPPAEPDTLRNYEIGGKGTLFDGRLSYEAAVYYIEWEDIQYFLWQADQTNTLSYAVITNGEASSGVGYEFALNFEPIDRLSFGIGYAHNGLKLEEPLLASTGQLLVPEGARPNFTSSYKVNGWASYGIPIGGFELRMAVSGSYASKLVAYKLLPGFSVDVLEGQPQRSVRAELEIDASNRWSAKLYAENLTDDRNLPLKASPLDPNHVFTARRQPRTLGMQLEYRFD